MRNKGKNLQPHHLKKFTLKESSAIFMYQTGVWLEEKKPSHICWGKTGTISHMNG